MLRLARDFQAESSDAFDAPLKWELGFLTKKLGLIRKGLMTVLPSANSGKEITRLERIGMLVY